MRKERQILVTIAIVAAVLSITYARAASLNVTPGPLAAGGSTIVPCDPDGVDVIYTLSGDTVTQMTVQDIAVGCVGGSLSVALVEGSGNNLGEGGPATVTGSSLTLSISPQPISFDVAAVHVVITGP
jgi:hypothetical protein